MALNINYKYAAAAFAIPEVCRFITAYSLNKKQDEAFDDYFALNPIGMCISLYKSVKEGRKFEMKDVAEVLTFFALGIAAPVACYFAVSKPRSVITIAPALALCAIQCGYMYAENRE